MLDQEKAKIEQFKTLIAVQSNKFVQKILIQIPEKFDCSHD